MTKEELHTGILTICKDLKGFTGYKLTTIEAYCTILGDRSSRFSLIVETRTGLYGFAGITGKTEQGALKELEDKVKELSSYMESETLAQELEHGGTL